MASARWKRRFRRRKRKRFKKLKRFRKVLKRKMGFLSIFGDKRYKLSARLAKLAFVGIILGSVGLFVVLPLLAFNLPSPDKIVRREGFSTKILDRDGEVLYDIYEDERRTHVELGEIPDYLKQATIAIEDKNFYEHQGFDPLGILRGISRVFTRGYAQGGSTLSQQLVKNVLLTPERTVTRKVKEFVITVQIENNFTKDEILQMYLNEMPYGGTSYGVQSASEVYFGKDVRDLDLVESAVLAGLPQRPSVYSPYSSTPDAYIARTQDVLRRMREDGYIDKDQEDSARDRLDEIEFQKPGTLFKAPHFVQYVQKVLEERYGEKIIEQGGLKVTTTLDLELHEVVQEIVADQIEEVEDLHITNGAAVIIDPETSEILSMVGSKDFSDPDYDGQVNVSLALRQPGSAIKPITYATALKEGYTASTLLMDVSTKFPSGAGQPPYEPVNYDGSYRGPVQARFALGNSINIPAVKMLAHVGVRDMLSTAYDLGINSLEPTNEVLRRVGLSVTLGGGEVRLLELTSAYGAFMNGGYRVEPSSILKVVDSNGKVLEDNSPEKGKRVLSEGVAFIISDILSDNNARSDVFGPNSLLNISGRQIAVKTGTTNDKRDNWTIGGNNQVVVGVWVGNNDNSPMLEVASGVTGASPIWREILLEALSDKPAVSFDTPESVVTAEVDDVSGYAAHDGFPSRLEYFVRGTEPGEDPVHVKLKVCKGEGKLATPSDIAAGNYEEKEYFIFKVDDPTGGIDGENMWQKGVDEWLSGMPDEKYHPPTEYCGESSQINVEFESPKDKDSNLGSSVNIRVRAASTTDVEHVELFVDGTGVISFDKPPYEYTINLDEGVHKLRAKARDKDGNESDREITIGVGVPWDYSPEPTPTNTPKPTNTPLPTPTL